MSTRFPGMKFSFLRLFIAVVVVALLLVFSFIGISYQIQSMKPLRASWTGGYVDVTETPAFEFESRLGTGQKNVVLAFVVSHDDMCEPSWGSYHTLDEADLALDLDRRIAQVQESGRTAVLSFGGAYNKDLADVCSTAEMTAKAMNLAISRYEIDTIDLDIENSSLTDVDGRVRRAEATAQLQEEASGRGEELAVWLTLPADRNGLTNDGVETVKSFLDAGVTLSGVNLMTMNFGVPSSETSMADLSQEALEAGHSQLLRLMISRGEIITAAQMWTMMGVTPMLGQNDEQDEAFSVEDAVELHSFAQSNNLGRISFWSLNRDRQCEANYINWSTAVNFCSGVAQETLEFDGVLSADRDGSAFQVPDRSMEPSDPQQSSDVVDDPQTSPYPIWSRSKTYLAEDKVVWKRNVYVALWTNKGYQPDATELDGQVAWRLVGPVLEGEKPRPRPQIPEGTYPDWNPEETYDVGDRVIYEESGYEAKWWTQGDSPGESQDSDASPWRVLTDEEVVALGGTIEEE